MGLFKDYVSQTRKPEGFLGKMMVNGMKLVRTKTLAEGADLCDFRYSRR